MVGLERVLQRCSVSTKPTDKAFTGQKGDAATTGLDYCNAGSYDPTGRQFVSADSVRDGQNRYAYVHWNPETHNDPSGHCWPICAIVAAVVVGAVAFVADAAVQTNIDGTAWHTVRDYQFSYEQTGPTGITDPVTGLQESVAGYLDLTKLQEVGDDGVTASPAQTFSYTNVTAYYVDGNFTPYSTTYCGPAWNTGGNGGTCDLWSQSQAGNSHYLAAISNGQGLSESFSWANARNNTHGVNSGIGTDIANPLYCNTLSAAAQATYPCNETDDQARSRVVLTDRYDSVVQLTQQGPGGTQSSLPVVSHSAYFYLNTYPLVAQECTDCVSGMYWGNQNDDDYLDEYNAQFMGFTQASVAHPDGSVETHRFYSTMGWGVTDVSKTCSSNVPPYTGSCQYAPWSDVRDAGHGREIEAFSYATDGVTLLKHTTAAYQAVCPPAGVVPDWNGQLVGELDTTSGTGTTGSNPMVVCDVQLTQSVTQMLDGSGGSGLSATATVDTETYNSYDAYGHVTKQTSTSNGGGSSPTSITHETQYNQPILSLRVPPIVQSSVNQESQWSGGLYMVDLPTYSDISDVENGNTVQTACSGSLYDPNSGNTTQESQYTGCAPTASGALRTTMTYDAAGNIIGTTDPNATTGCPAGRGSATDCTTYTSTTDAQTASTTNALGQTNSLSYSNTPSGGYGLWPTSTTDANSQVTTNTYDALGRPLTTSLPGETGPWTSSTSYTNWCSGSGGTNGLAPCVEVDSTQRLDSSGDTVTARSFFDGAGRIVETRSSAPGGHDVVQYTLYNTSGQAWAQSVRYFVAAYTGAPGSAAYSIPDTSQAVSSTSYDGLGRTLSVTDPLSFVTTTSYTIVCSPLNTNGDTGCYERTLVIDANSHQTGTFADAFGRAVYARTWSGNSSGTYALYATTTTTYDSAGRVRAILHPDGASQTTATYDTAGRLLDRFDPDRGYEYYCYDNNGNLLVRVDARSSTSGEATCTPPNNLGTTYTGYDALNRPAWRGSTSNPNTASVTWNYVASGNGIGQLASESFNGGMGGSALGHGQYTYAYDVRAQQSGQTINLGGTNYSFTTNTNDAGEPTSLTYSDGEYLSYFYDASSGALNALATTPQGGSTTNLLLNVTYNATAQVTSANVANAVYYDTASYDLDTRLTSQAMVTVSTNTTDWSSTRAYDAVGNVTSVQQRFAQGTDNQGFCYDEQNRLVWASASGSPPCGGQIPSGSLSAAYYGPSAFAYDTADRMTSSPTGTSIYDPHHVHAVDSIGSSYSAAYDAAGNMTCRAPTSSSLCVGGSNGQLLSYDNEGRTTGWQNTPTNPTSTEQMAYDGEGHRVALQVNGGTPTYYLGSLEEVSGSTLTKYLSSGLAGVPVAERMGTNGPLSYLVSYGLGSLSEVLSSSGTITDEQLYTPYGSQRYSSGTPPTSYGFTGQRADGASRLDYYNARYYDPVARQFASADTADDGLNRYGYVHGNPETLTDPTGNSVKNCGVDSDICTGAGGGYAGIDPTTDGGSGLGVNGGGQGPACTSNCDNGGTDGTGKPLSYTMTSSDPNDPCADPNSAACKHAKDAKADYLDGLATQSAIFDVAADGLELGIDIARAAVDRDPVDLAESFIGIVLTFVDAIKPLSYLLHIDDQISEAWTSMAYVVLAFARGFLAMLHAANVFTRAIVLAGWASFQLTTGSSLMGLVKLLVFLANPILATFVGMGVMFLKANEHAADQEYDEVSGEDPKMFCELHPGKC